MNYTMLIPVLTEAMKEQQKMIETQQKLVEQHQIVQQQQLQISAHLEPII